MPQRKTCLDLFAGRGGFSSAFQAAEGWDVVTVDDDPVHDPDIEADIGTLQASDPRLPDAPNVVLASPPCRTFSKAAGWVGHYGDDGETPATDDARDAIVLARHAQGLIEALDPEYYVIENPEGSKLKQLFGPPDQRLTYCQYGTAYRKATWFWGELPDVEFRYCSPGAACHDGGSLADDPDARPLPRESAARAEVPRGVSDAVLLGIEWVLDVNSSGSGDRGGSAEMCLDQWVAGDSKVGGLGVVESDVYVSPDASQSGGVITLQSVSR